MFALIVKVVGLDYCGLMIAAAQKLQNGNAIEYSDKQVAQISSIGESIDPSQVQFVQVNMLYNVPNCIAIYFVKTSIHKNESICTFHICIKLL